MDGVLNAIRGELKPASDHFYNCVMCGLCAMVCDVRITPHWVGLFSRRVVGRSGEDIDLGVNQRIQEIEEGRFQEEWKKVQALDEKELQQVIAGKDGVSK